MNGSEKRRVLVALAALVLALLACKHTYTPPGSSADASADVVEELATEATGACEPKVGNRKCLAGGKAAYCKTIYMHEYPRDMRTRGEWVTVTCPDCTDTGSFGLRCSEFVVGQPCDTFMLQQSCTKDKLAMYTCDSTTSTWQLEKCAGGCKDDPPSPPFCKH